MQTKMQLYMETTTLCKRNTDNTKKSWLGFGRDTLKYTQPDLKYTSSMTKINRPQPLFKGTEQHIPQFHSHRCAHETVRPQIF